MNNDHDVVILGAGISGLALAWFLRRRGVSVLIIEKSTRTGGWIQTVEKDGFLFELGPHSCRAAGNGYITLQLVEELGLQNQIVIADPAARKKYLFVDKTLAQLPTNPLFFPFSSLTRGLLTAAIHDWRTPPNACKDESIYDFMARRFSVEIAEKLVDPIVSGIYAGDMRRLSIASCFPAIHQLEQQYGSVTRGLFSKRKPKEPVSAFVRNAQRAGIFSFRNGMETLTDELSKRLNASIVTSCFPKNLHFDSKGVDIELSNGQMTRASHLISTLPAHSLANLLAPYQQKLAGMLQEIESASVAMVHCGYRQQVLKKSGFGYLIPSQENEKILGVIWDSCVFPGQNRHPSETRLTVMMGGSHRPELCAFDEQARATAALQSIEKHLGVKTKPDVVHHAIAWRAIPQYHVGYSQKIELIKRLLAELSPRISCIGSSFFGVSINDCIENAKKRAEETNCLRNNDYTM